MSTSSSRARVFVASEFVIVTGYVRRDGMRSEGIVLGQFELSRIIMNQFVGAGPQELKPYAKVCESGVYARRLLQAGFQPA